MTPNMSLTFKNRHSLRSKDIKIFQSDLINYYGETFFDKKSSVEIAESDGLNIVFVDNEPSFMLYESKIFFTLYGINKYKPKKKFVVVDMGAVKFVTNGADVMGPGIVDADKNIVENDQVWVCDENYRKPLAVGIAVISGEQMVGKMRGKAVKIIHFIGDEIWNFSSKNK